MQAALGAAPCALWGRPRATWGPPSPQQGHAGLCNFLPKVPAQGPLSTHNNVSLQGCGQDTYLFLSSAD